jgi:hypothetical protein
MQIVVLDAKTLKTEELDLGPWRALGTLSLYDRTYNYLSPHGKHHLLEMLKNDFKVDLWEYLHDIDRCGSELNSLIYQFMELNGIKEDGTSSDTIKKIYQRKKNSYKTALNRKMKKKIPT